MFNNLYNFSKNSWHVKLFKWIYNIDPTQQFKSMCPYFWTYVITLLFFPLVLIIKLFGKSGTLFLNYLKDYSRNKANKAIESFKARVGDGESLTNEEAYKLKRSNCYSNNWYQLDWNVTDLIDFKSREYSRNELPKIRYAKEQQIKEFKESTIYQVISYILALIVSIAGIYVIYQLYLVSNDYTIMWKEIGGVLLFISIFVAGVFGIVGLIKYIIIPIGEYLACLKTPKCYLCQLGIWKFVSNIFKTIWLGFCLIGDMIYNTYKKNCPLITWKE